MNLRDEILAYVGSDNSALVKDCPEVSASDFSSFYEKQPKRSGSGAIEWNPLKSFKLSWDGLTDTELTTKLQVNSNLWDMDNYLVWYGSKLPVFSMPIDLIVKNAEILALTHQPSFCCGLNGEAIDVEFLLEFNGVNTFSTTIAK